MSFAWWVKVGVLTVSKSQFTWFWLVAIFPLLFINTNNMYVGVWNFQSGLIFQCHHWTVHVDCSSQGYINTKTKTEAKAVHSDWIDIVLFTTPPPQCCKSGQSFVCTLNINYTKMSYCLSKPHIIGNCIEMLMYKSFVLTTTDSSKMCRKDPLW